MLETGISTAAWLEEPDEVIMIALRRVEEIRKERRRAWQG